MIEYLDEIRVELLAFGAELLQARLGKGVTNADLSLLGNSREALEKVADYMMEWQLERDIVEVDDWLKGGGYDKIFKIYRPEEALWLHYFQWFFSNSWEVLPSYLPADVDWAIYNEVRGKGLKGCPNFGLALERATKIVEIKGETNETLRRLSEISAKAR